MGINVEDGACYSIQFPHVSCLFRFSAPAARDRGAWALGHLHVLAAPST